MFGAIIRAPSADARRSTEAPCLVVRGLPLWVLCMVDHEEWRFGDEPSGTVCPVCGKANRAGQIHCAFCGTPLDAESDSDPLALRTIGEAMTGGRSERGRRRRERPWMWPVAVVALLAAAAGGYWWSQAPERHLPWDLDILSLHAPSPSVGVSPVALPRVESRAERPPPRPVEPRPAVLPPPPVVVPQPPVATALPRAVPRPPLAAVPPPAAAPIMPARPTPVRVAAPPPASVPSRAARVVRRATPRAVAPSPIESEQRAAVPPVPAAERTPSPPPAADATTPPAEQRSEEERPALGSDLVSAQRAYRTAVEAYNARADEYNEIADEVQRGDLAGDTEHAAALQMRLEHTRAAAERAQAEADKLRARMEEVRARYK
jgi:hypothetical protein